jgi:hypothetical protein
MNVLVIVTILGVAVSGTSARALNPIAKTSASKDGESVISEKLEHMEKSLGAIAKSKLAPPGIDVLLNDIHHAHDQVNKEQHEENRRAIFQNISKEIAAFQGQLVQRKKQLVEADNKDKAERIKSFGDVAEKLKARETQIEASEHKAQAAHKTHQQKLAKMKSGSKTTEDHTQKLLKYLGKKQERKFHKNMAKWKQEKMALHEAIDAAQSGNSSNLLSGMKKLTNIEKGDQNFLH